MMGIDPERQALRSYQAVLGEWNDRHQADNEPPPLDPDRVRHLLN